MTPDKLTPPQVALAHHWLVGMRGGEKVLEQFAGLLPSAPIFTLLARRASLSPMLNRHPLVESPIGRLPAAARLYRHLLPLYPATIPSLRVSAGTRLLLTSDASVIKGLSVSPATTHVCYCHSPPRYLWGLQETYLKHTAGLGLLGRTAFRAVTPYLRRFDYEAAQRVDFFLANSTFVQGRIREHYGRDSEVIHPPVSVDDFRWDQPKADFYLIVSEMVAYKRVDLAVQAFNLLNRKLVVIGGGPEMDRLRTLAGPNITFLGRQPFPVLKEHFERCRAFVFPTVEDFGITPLEAQAAGSPVIALGIGGALETVVAGQTGRFFAEQTVENLVEAVKAFETETYSAATCRANAERFRPEIFRARIREFLTRMFPQPFTGYPWPAEASGELLPNP
jgi:glycosyltransferase involved in cell wall biosynthesis